MKKILFTTVAIMALGLMNAQEVKYGAKVGLNLSNVTGDIEDTKNKTGLLIGGYAEIKVTDKFSVQPEISYSAQGTKAEDSYSDMYGSITIDLTQKLNYLNVPVMAKYYVDKKFYLEAGPQIGFLLSAEQKAVAKGIYYGESVYETETVDNKSSLNSTDFGINIGLGFNFTDKIGANLRYTSGLSDIDKEDNNSEIYNSNIGISISYNF